MHAELLGNTCVVGLQWGDEGKGKVVDALVGAFDAVVRYSGGANAGHTVVVNGERFALHQLPSGVLHPGVKCLIVSGSVLDPAVLLGELEGLRQRGIDPRTNLRISDRVHLVFPYHRRQDVLAERAAPPGAALGTTARGIGPCYADKVSRRWGIRLCELYNPDRLRRRLATIVAHKNAYLKALYDEREGFDANTILEEYLHFAERLRPFVCDTTEELARLLAEDRRILFEGTQGTLLDIDYGTYPYVTSAGTTVGSAVSGAAVPPGAIHSVVGVVKAYATRVGSGPMPTELRDALGERLRTWGGEYGTTTGRPRRCGWFDAVAARYAVRVTHPTHLALLHLDTLSGFDSLRVCVAYRQSGRILTSMPPDATVLDEVEPVYETLHGWRERIDQVRRWDDLPEAARRYVNRIGELLGVPVRMIGVGPGREQTIMVEDGAANGKAG